MNKNYILTILILGISCICKSNEPEEKYYQIVSIQLQESINIPRASEKNGERLIVWDKNDCRFNQEWKLEPFDNYYIIRSKYNNKVITANNEIVVQMDFVGSRDQLWKIEKVEDYIYISSVKNGLALTVFINGLAKKELLLKKLERNESQKWIMEPSGMEYVKADFNRILSPEEMKEDLNYFFEKLEAVHVNPYAFVGKDSIDQRKEELIKTFSKPLKFYEFNREFAKFNGLLDGHSEIFFDRNYVNTYVDSYGRLFAFDVKYYDNGLYIKSDEDSINNLKIVAINGISSDSMITEIKKIKSLESELKRNLFLESYFKTLIVGILEVKAPYILEVKDTYSGKAKTMTVEGSPYFKLPEKIYVPHPDYALREYLEDSIAIIEYNTCIANDRSRWENDIDSIFNLVKKHNIKYLFLDISRNGGGGTSTNQLFYKNINHQPNPFTYQYIRKTSLESKLYISKLSAVRSDEEYNRLLEEYLSFISTKRFTDEERKSLEQKEGKFYQNDGTWCTDEINNGFDGELIIIQSLNTYSAAFDMAAWFKYGKVGTIIGYETGGRTEVFCEGIPFRMPNSQMRFRIADNYWKFPDGNLYKGIMPDINLGYEFYKDKYELEDLKDYLKIIKD